MLYLETALVQLKKEFPDFALYYKRNSRLMKGLGTALKVVSFGQVTHFLSEFVTTFGNTVYVPDLWDEMKDVDKVVILRHERVHMRQQRRLGRASYYVRYLCWPLPGLFAFGRRELEREAYEETMRADKFFHGLAYVTSDAYKKEITAEFSGPSYFWCWANYKDNEAWFDYTLAKLCLEESYHTA